MWTVFDNLFNTEALSPHGICLLWRPGLMWLHIASDTVIGFSYYSIPIALAAFVSRRGDVAFAVFILACGTTHFFSIWTLFVPDYGAEGLIKAATAAVSLVTAIGLWPLLPKALALPSPRQLHEANAALRAGIAERDAALAALQREKEERQRAEDMLRQAQKLDAVGQLTAGIAHDFNNLLTVVVGNVDRARRRLDRPEEAARALDAANAGALRAAELTRRLLAFGRRQALTPQRIDANAFVTHGADTFRRTLGETVRIETELAGDLWTAWADPRELESALLNLAINARDAMAGGGTLTLATRNVDGDDIAGPGSALSGAFIEIAVSDTGQGMSKDVAMHAFDPFFTTKPAGEGSGLGLSQVYGFAQQSHGTAVIDTAPGRGTTIRLYLPRWQPAVETAAASPDHAVMAPARS